MSEQVDLVVKAMAVQPDRRFKKGGNPIRNRFQLADRVRLAVAVACGDVSMRSAAKALGIAPTAIPTEALSALKMGIQAGIVQINILTPKPNGSEG